MSISIIGSTPVTVTENGTERELLYNTGSQTAVVANPTGEATDELETLQVGTTVYSVGSGTEVVANPEGEATDELETLQVGNTVYSVGGAGGGVVIAHRDGENLDIKPSDIFTGTTLTGMAYLQSDEGYIIPMDSASYLDGYYRIVIDTLYASNDINTVFTVYSPPGP